MNVRPLDILRRAARRIRHRSAPWGVVLLYHRIAEPSKDPFDLCVSPRHFGEHLGVLRKWATVARLRDLFASEPPVRSARPIVAVTFDDGYKDNLTEARPMLERADIPATLFALAGESGEEFWWDDLEQVLFRPETLPSSLNVAGEEMRSEERSALYLKSHRTLQRMPQAERRNAIRTLKSQVNVSTAPPLRLTDDELRSLASGGLVEIGGHSLTHPVLSRLSVEEQRREIFGCKRRLEELLGSPLRSFAYPFGASTDFNQDSVDLVKQAGFESGFAVASDALWHSTDRFQVPRVIVTDCDGARFERYLRWLTFT